VTNHLKEHMASKKPQSREGRGAPPPGSWQRFLPLLLILAGVAVYLNSFDGVFLFDDRPRIVENEQIRQLRPLWRLLSSRRPVVELSLAVNYAMGGLNPGGYHAFNLTVHLLAALTLFGVVRRTWVSDVSRPKPAGDSRNALSRSEPAPMTHASGRWLALAVSLIWVVHPLQTQSVSYLVQRAESLMGLFYLLTLYCVIRGAASSHGRLWYVSAVIACVLGMASKAVMVTIPVVILLYDRVFIARSFAAALRRRWGLYVCLAATWGILWASGVMPSVLNPATLSATVGFAFKRITSLEYALTQSEVILYYLRLAFWPHPLCLDYAWPVAQRVSDVTARLIVIVGLLLAVVWLLRRKPWLGFLGAWFFIILAPTSSFVPTADPLFEHRMYLPLAAVIVLVVLAGYVAISRLSKRGSLSVSHGSRLMAVLVVAVVAALGYQTVRRNQDYRSELGMWRDIAHKRPNNARGRYSLGTALLNRNDLSGAVRELRAAMRADPKFAPAPYNLSHALARKGLVDEAIQASGKAVDVDPRLIGARVHLADLLLASTDRINEAIHHYREALRMDPKLAGVHENLGKALYRQGEIEEAVQSFRRAVSLRPDLPGPHFGLGLVLAKRDRFDEAIREYREVLRLQPGYPEARRALEDALAKQQR